MLVSESHPFCLEYLVGKAGTFVEIKFRAIWTYKSMQNVTKLKDRLLGRLYRTKRLAIRLGLETLSQRHAAHAQQRSHLIHAESFSRVHQNLASERKALLTE